VPNAMKFLEKVAGYVESYNTVNNKEGLIKVATEDGVTPDDLVAYHNLMYGNMFTGEGLIKTAGENGSLVALGTMIDKVIKEEMEMGDLYKEAQALGMDEEDVDAVLNVIEKQAMEAGVINEPVEVTFNENTPLNKVAEAMDYLEANGINPVDAITIAANVTPEGNIDEKIAEEIVAVGYTGEHMEKIAEAIAYMGGLTPETIEMVETLYQEAN